MNPRAAGALLWLAAASAAQAQLLPPPPPSSAPLVAQAPVASGAIVVNADIQARLHGRLGETSIQGRLSVHLAVPDRDRLPNRLEVRGLNIAYFGVQQEAVTGIAPRNKATGVLGFAAEQGKTQYLEYDPQTGVVSGTVAGQIDLPQFAELSPPTRDEPGDDFRTLTQPATVRVQFNLQDRADLYTKREAVERRRASMEMDISTGPEPALRVTSYRILVDRAVVDMELGWIPFIEVAKRLCVQPVRIGQITAGGFPPSFSVKFSGAGLDFGKPGAIEQWNKADVVFSWRDWMTIWNPSYMAFGQAESADLRDEVNVDDCIEVFFVDTFTPSVFWGGGATYSSGLASAKVISTDQNAAGGVDLTHLAHELGHVLSLMHPGSGSVKDASTGTLLCPSGFNNDNPKINSEENKNLVSNPLLVFAIKIRTAGPDCVDSASCGACG